MPIKPELLHHYRTPEYKAARARVVERSGNKCEQCGKPNGARVETITGRSGGMLLRMYWRTAGAWHNCEGTRVDSLLFGSDKVRTIRVVCTCAHLDHTPGHDQDDNLKFLCQWCHLNYDALHHKQTRSKRKDGKRPILQGETANA